MRARCGEWKVGRENEQRRKEFVQCPSSRFVFPQKCARMQHRPVYQVVKTAALIGSGRAGMTSLEAPGMKSRQTGMMWDEWGGGRGARWMLTVR